MSSDAAGTAVPAASASAAAGVSALAASPDFLSVGAGIKEKLAAMKAQKLAAKQKRAADAAAAAAASPSSERSDFLAFDASPSHASAHDHALAAADTPATPANANGAAASSPLPGFSSTDDFISLTFFDEANAAAAAASAAAATPARGGTKRKASGAPDDSDGGDSVPAVVSEGVYKAPWATRAYPHRNFTLRLHEELLDFCSYVSPKPAEQQMRAELIDRLNLLVKAAFPNSPAVHLKPFGSYATALYLPISDIDLVLFGVTEGGRFTPGDKGRQSPLGVLERHMRSAQCATYLEHISGARIPILKLTDKATGVKVDICYDVSGGLRAAEFILAAQRQLPALRPLTLFLKYFLHCRILNDTYKGGIGSFMLQLMLISHLQTLQLEGRMGSPSTNLGMVLMSFLEAYGVSINYKNAGLNMNAVQNAAIAAAADNAGIPERNAFAQPRSNNSSSSLAPRYGFYNKSSRQWLNAGRPYLLSIENPLDASHDVGANSYLIMRVRKALQFAYHTIAAHVYYENARMEKRGESIITRAQRHAIARAQDPAHPFAAPSHVPLTLLSLIVSVNDELREDQVEVEFDEMAGDVAVEEADRVHRRATNKNVHVIESDSETEPAAAFVQPKFGEADVDAASSDDDDNDDPTSGPSRAFDLSERGADVDVDADAHSLPSSAAAGEEDEEEEEGESSGGEGDEDAEDTSDDDDDDAEGSDEDDEDEDDDDDDDDDDGDMEDLDDRLLRGPDLPYQQQQSHSSNGKRRRNSSKGGGSSSSHTADFIPLGGGGGAAGSGGGRRHKKGAAYRFDNAAPKAPRQHSSSKKKKAAQLQRGTRTGGTRPNNGIFESKRSKDRKSSKKKHDKASSRKKQRTQ